MSREKNQFKIERKAEQAHQHSQLNLLLSLLPFPKEISIKHVDYVRKRHKNSNDRSCHHQEEYTGQTLVQTTSSLPTTHSHPRPRTHRAAHPPEAPARCRRPPGGDLQQRGGVRGHQRSGGAPIPPPPHPHRRPAPPHLSAAVPQPLLGRGEAGCRVYPRLHVPHRRGRRQLEGPAAQAVMEDGHPGQPATTRHTPAEERRANALPRRPPPRTPSPSGTAQARDGRRSPPEYSEGQAAACPSLPGRGEGAARPASGAAPAPPRPRGPPSRPAATHMPAAAHKGPLAAPAAAPHTGKGGWGPPLRAAPRRKRKEGRREEGGSGRRSRPKSGGSGGDGSGLGGGERAGDAPASARPLSGSPPGDCRPRLCFRAGRPRRRDFPAPREASRRPAPGWRGSWLPLAGRAPGRASPVASGEGKDAALAWPAARGRHEAAGAVPDIGIRSRARASFSGTAGGEAHTDASRSSQHSGTTTTTTRS